MKDSKFGSTHVKTACECFARARAAQKNATKEDVIRYAETGLDNLKLGVAELEEWQDGILEPDYSHILTQCTTMREAWTLKILQLRGVQSLNTLDQHKGD
jgi:hypothetical protein